MLWNFHGPFRTTETIQVKSRSPWRFHSDGKTEVKFPARTVVPSRKYKCPSRLGGFRLFRTVAFKRWGRTAPRTLGRISPTTLHTSSSTQLLEFTEWKLVEARAEERLAVWNSLEKASATRGSSEHSFDLMSIGQRNVPLLVSRSSSVSSHFPTDNSLQSRALYDEYSLCLTIFRAGCFHWPPIVEMWINDRPLDAR